MNLLFTYELARRLEGTGVTANVLHPGWVATGFAGNNGWKGRLWQLFARCFAINAEEGARTVVYLSSSSEVTLTLRHGRFRLVLVFAWDGDRQPLPQSASLA